MRGVSLLLDNSNKISYKSAKGFWWDGELSDIYFEDNYLGDLQAKLSLFDVIKGRSIFFIKLPSLTMIFPSFSMSISPIISFKSQITIQPNRKIKQNL